MKLTDVQRKARRNALRTLGLTAAAVYAAPVVTRLDVAQAAFPSQCPPQRPQCGQAGNGNAGGRGRGRRKFADGGNHGW